MTDDIPSETWELKLYIAGVTPKSRRVIENLKGICAEYLKGEIFLEVVDLLQHPERAKLDQIAALPTLVRVSPLPIRKLIGDLSDRATVLSSLDLVKKSYPSVG